MSRFVKKMEIVRTSASLSLEAAPSSRSRSCAASILPTSPSTNRQTTRDWRPMEQKWCGVSLMLNSSVLMVSWWRGSTEHLYKKRRGVLCSRVRPTPDLLFLCLPAKINEIHETLVVLFKHNLVFRQHAFLCVQFARTTKIGRTTFPTKFSQQGIVSFLSGPAPEQIWLFRTSTMERFLRPHSRLRPSWLPFGGVGATHCALFESHVKTGDPVTHQNTNTSFY